MLAFPAGIKTLESYDLHLFHVGLTGCVIDTVKIASSKAKARPSRRKSSQMPSLSTRCIPPLRCTVPRVVSRRCKLRSAIFYGLFTFRRRQRPMWTVTCRALSRREETHVDKRKVMDTVVGRWNLFASERRRAPRLTLLKPSSRSHEQKAHPCFPPCSSKRTETHKNVFHRLCYDQLDGESFGETRVTSYPRYISVIFEALLLRTVIPLW